ncbi:putative CN hydrolase domain-containing protein [Seiridium cardinale]
MSMDSPQFLSLLEAFKDAGIYGTFRFSELAEDKIFMGQILVGPHSTVLHHRRKLRPFGTERYIWSEGDISELKVTATPHGRIVFQPTMTFAMQAQMENIPIAAFPYAPDFGTDPQAWESAELEVEISSFAQYDDIFQPYYDADGEQSWAALQQMIAEFPSYIPRVSGTYFDHQDHSIESITS